MSEEEDSVILVSQEGRACAITPRMAAMSRLLLLNLEDEMSTEEDETVETAPPPPPTRTIPLPNVQTRELIRVVAFMREHLERPLPAIQKPLRSARMRDLVSAWDADFVDLEQEELFALILAANYLDMPALLDLTTAKAASMIKGKTPAEIRAIFGGSAAQEEEETPAAAAGPGAAE